MQRHLDRQVREAGGLLVFVRKLRQQRKTFSDWAREQKKLLTIAIYRQRSSRSHSKTQFRMPVPDIIVTPREMTEYYRDHRDDFTEEISGSARQIILYISDYESVGKTREEAEKIHSMAERGENFAEVARKYSGGPRARTGGLYELSGEAGLRKDLAKRIENLEEGEMTPVFRSGDKFHIIKLVEKSKKVPIPFEKVHERIKREVARRHFEREERLLMNRLIERAYILPPELRKELKKAAE
jgi:hypothetical protein